MFRKPRLALNIVIIKLNCEKYKHVAIMRNNTSICLMFIFLIQNPLNCSLKSESLSYVGQTIRFLDFLIKQ